VVEDFLGQLISSGSEREHFGDLVKKMTKVMGPMDGFRDINETYANVRRISCYCCSYMLISGGV